MLMREPTITNKKKDLKKAELFVKSRLLQILFIITHHPTERHSLPFSTPPNPAPCQNIHAHNNAEQRRGQEGKSARRGDGLRNYECFPFSQITHFQKVKTIIQKNQTIQFPHTSKGENYNPQKSNYPIYLTSKSENYNPKKSNHPISSHFKK